MKKTKKITFRATDDLKQKVEQLAELQGISTGQLIRNWINVFLKNQVLNSNRHTYQVEDGRQFSDMKDLCNELNISSRTARSRVKKGVIKKLNINPYQTQKYGEELSSTKSRATG